MAERGPYAPAKKSTVRARVDMISRMEVAIDVLNSAARSDFQDVIDPAVRRSIIMERDRIVAAVSQLLEDLSKERQ